MKKHLYLCWFLMIVSLIIFLFPRCKKVVEPIAEEIPANVSIEDAWLSEMEDIDGDEYYSDGKLYFDLGTNKIAGVDAFVWLGYKRSVYLDSNTYHKCFVSVDLTVKKNKDNIWFINFSNFTDSLPRDYYDLMLVAKLSSAPNDFEDKESEDEDIRFIPLEPPAEDTLSSAHHALEISIDQTIPEVLPFNTR